jgi:phage baseplate assembly protein gpV
MQTLELGSELRAYGVTGGGTLAVQARKVQIGDTTTAPDADTLHVSGDFFKKASRPTTSPVTKACWSPTAHTLMFRCRSTIRVNRLRPRQRAATRPPRWSAGPRRCTRKRLKGVLTQRRGASLNLNAGTTIASGALAATTALTVGKGAVVTVDPGQAINLRSIGQLTVDGTLNAWGGTVSLAGWPTASRIKSTPSAMAVRSGSVSRRSLT